MNPKLEYENLIIKKDYNQLKRKDSILITDCLIATKVFMYTKHALNCLKVIKQ